MKPQTLLIVEDNEEDYEHTVRAFRKVGISNSLYRCADGDEALDYLLRRDKYADPETSPRPGVILLDLNLPGTDGREVLEEVKNHKDLSMIPLIVLTTSSDERDIDACYRLGANSYITKPVDVHGFIDAITLLKNFWLELAVLPH